MRMIILGIALICFSVAWAEFVPCSTVVTVTLVVLGLTGLELSLHGYLELRRNRR